MGARARLAGTRQPTNPKGRAVTDDDDGGHHPHHDSYCQRRPLRPWEWAVTLVIVAVPPIFALVLYQQW